MLVSRDEDGKLFATNPAVAAPWTCPASEFGHYILSDREFTALMVGDVPVKWASGGTISEDDRLRMALLRVAGCRCELPLLGFNPESFKAPRCRSCNAVVFMNEPTPEQKRARDQAQHQANKETMRLHPELRQYVEFKDLDACYPGCGCPEVTS